MASFPSIDHAILLELLAKRIADRRLFDLLRRIVAAGAGVLDDEAAPGFFPGDDLFAAARPRGLPIGNLTSQFFANVLLDPVDHFVKETLRVPGYVRYCDDLVLFADDKAALWHGCGRLQAELGGLRLRLHGDKTVVRPSRCGLKFLGFLLRPDERRLQQSALASLNRHRRRWRWRRARGTASVADSRQALRAWLAYANAANWVGICRALGLTVLCPVR